MGLLCFEEVTVQACVMGAWLQGRVVGGGHGVLQQHSLNNGGLDVIDSCTHSAYVWE